VLEATARQTRDVVDTVNADAGTPLARLAVDGGMIADNLLMQTVADVLDVPVIHPALTETVALGAAYAARAWVPGSGRTGGRYDALETGRRVESHRGPLPAGGGVRG
jgi:glycerol kinase